MLIAGEKRKGSGEIEVYNPYDGSVIGTIARGTAKDVDDAVEAAVEGQREWSAFTAYQRYEVLHKAAQLLTERSEDFSKVLAKEVGKTIAEARGETARAIQTLTLSAEEAKRLTGEEVRFDGAPTGGGKMGFYCRVPLGVIAAITPFNFPLNLGMHKVAPALAAGNSVVLKPATVTPLSSLMLGELLWEAGVPPKAFNVVTGPGGEVGDSLVQHPKVKMVTFTGSRDVGKEIMAKAGFKKSTMELGSNSAVVVCEDSDLDAAASRCCGGAYALAGQVCISVQRIFVQNRVFDSFVEKFVEKVKALKVGDQLSEETNMGPMITAQEAQRVLEWIDEAVKAGAKLVVGGEVDGAMLSPSVVTNCPRDVKLFQGEAFGPVVLINPYNTIDEAIEMVNDSPYGLQGGIYTSNISYALKAVREIDAGGVMVNEVPTFRVDLMPYGGMKESGMGREGPAFAIEEMTEIKLICFNL